MASSVRRERGSAGLRRGDCVGVAATGFAVPRPALERGLSWLRAAGFELRIGEHVRDCDGYLAGSDAQRLDDLTRLIDDREVRAIWFARGGFGTARLLDGVPWRRLRNRRKLLVGYSDLTALFAPAVDRAGVRCLYGPVVSELGNPRTFHAGSLRAALAGRVTTWTFRARDVLCPGRARGRTAGGNLTVLTHLVGTRYACDLNGAILFLEEIGEPTYRIDRMLTQLRGSRAFAGLRGVVLGRFDVPARKRFPPDRRWTEVILETFGPLGIPVVRGFPAGHVDGKRTLPLGAEARIDTTRRRVELGG